MINDTRNSYKSDYFAIASKNAIQTSDAGTISIICESKNYHDCSHLDPKFDYTLSHINKVKKNGSSALSAHVHILQTLDCLL